MAGERIQASTARPTRPGKWRRRLGWTLVILLAALTAAWFALQSPDTERATMIARYGGDGSRFVTLADGARVHMRDSGGDLPPMVLVHGSNDSLHTFIPLTQRLRSRFRVITLDLPGHGLTGATPTGRYDMAENIAAVRGVAQSLRLDRFILGGNSLGGSVSWRYALEHPEQVQALILLDPAGMPLRARETPPDSNLGFRLMQYPLGRWALRGITPRRIVRQSLEGSVANPAIVTDAMVDRYWELLRFPGNRDATMLRFSRSFIDGAAAARIGEITAPALVLFGAEDRIIRPTAARSFGERMRDADVVVLDGVGHLPQLEVPDQTAAAIVDFLEREE